MQKDGKNIYRVGDHPTDPAENWDAFMEACPWSEEFNQVWDNYWNNELSSVQDTESGAVWCFDPDELKQEAFRTWCLGEYETHQNTLADKERMLKSAEQEAKKAAQKAKREAENAVQKAKQETVKASQDKEKEKRSAASKKGGKPRSLKKVIRCLYCAHMTNTFISEGMSKKDAEIKLQETLNNSYPSPSELDEDDIVHDVMNFKKGTRAKYISAGLKMFEQNEILLKPVGKIVDQVNLNNEAGDYSPTYAQFKRLLVDTLKDPHGTLRPLCPK